MVIVAAVAIVSVVLLSQICPIVATLAIAVPEAPYWIPHDPFCNEDPVKHPETIPQTSATILGLANFGFLLGVRLNKPEMRIQYKFLAVAFAAIAVTTVLQMALIMHAHGDSLHQPFYHGAMFITTGALLLVGLCFVQIVSAGSRAEKKDMQRKGYVDDGSVSSHGSEG